MTDTSSMLPSPLNYEMAREFMIHKDPKIRAALAAHEDTPEEILYFLAEDKNRAVREAVAQNTRTPRQADLVLTKDLDPIVRHQLANKIGRVLPNLQGNAKDIVVEMTADVLNQLAIDEIDYVRQMLADMIKDLPNVPENVIQTLCYDKSLTVAEPILQFSPVLSDQDLMGIVNTHPLKGAIAIISKRENVSEEVSGAIINSGNAEAIQNLLENETSNISEESMDHLMESAPENNGWHKPLVHRPGLSQKTITRLTDFVAMQLLDELQKRTDLDDNTLLQLVQAVEERRIQESREATQDNLDPEIMQLKEIGGLDEAFVMEALKEGSRKKIISAISAMSEVPYDIVANTLGNPRPKRICALCYQAGISAKGAATLQARVAKLPKSLIISPTIEGEYAMSIDEIIKTLDELD